MFARPLGSVLLLAWFLAMACGSAGDTGLEAPPPTTAGLDEAAGVSSTAPTAANAPDPSTPTGDAAEDETAESATSTPPPSRTPSDSPVVPATVPAMPDVFEASKASCDYGDLGVVTTITDPALVEVSGLGFSRLRPDLLWAHNDSGDGANLYGSSVDVSASAGGSGPAQLVTATEVFAIDWEDMAIIGTPGEPGTVYVGDIGDNRELRAFVFVYRFVEPEVPADTAPGAVEVIVERFSLAYPEGPRDAEALLVDPLDGDLFIITKGGSAEPVVYRAAAADLTDGGAVTMQAVAALDVRGQVTAADFSYSGDRVVVRTYEEVLVFPRIDEGLGSTFGQAPCAFPGPDEPQGEAVAFDESNGIVMVSEGNAPAVYRLAPNS